jgi:tetratricopeptide (TPR) repeat protein
MPWGRRLGVASLLLTSMLACARGKAPDKTSEPLAAAPDAAAGPNQAERQRPVADLAPAMDAGAPLTGPEGVDAYGYPLKHVDRAAVRGMLAAKRYADLTALFTKLQDDFEADQTRESWVIDAGDAFDSAEPELAPGIDAWVAAAPDSFAPHFARGTCLHAVAFAKRGAKWANDTPAEDLAAMKEPRKESDGELEKAIKLRPKLVAAMKKKMGGAGPDATLIARALAACPSCFRVRVTHMQSLAPRWGGSYAQMDAFAKKSAKEQASPAMKLLAGFADQDKANLLRHDHKPEDALAAADRACSVGDYWGFLLERALIQLERNDVPEARVDIDRAATLRPGEPEILATRAYVSSFEKKYEQAAADVRDVLRMSPTNERARALKANLIDGLVYEAWQHEAAGRKADALRVLALGLELSPNEARLRQRYDALIVGGAGSPSGVEALEDAVRRAPDDFDAHQKLDYALSRLRRFDRVIEVWNGYLARHPEDGRAYLERGGAYFNLGKVKEAYADATQACSHGSSEGCARAKQVGPPAQ